MQHLCGTIRYRNGEGRFLDRRTMRAFFSSLQNGTILDSFFAKFGLTAGVLIILAIGILIFLVVAIVAERKTRILFPDRNQAEGDDGGFLNFDDD